MGHTLSAKEIPGIQGMPGTLQNIPFADFLKRIHAAKQEEEKREKIGRYDFRIETSEIIPLDESRFVRRRERRQPQNRAHMTFVRLVQT